MLKDSNLWIKNHVSVLVAMAGLKVDQLHY